ncbi:MAG: PadR family transcriptional regulator [Thaumarchaeota archaeon]|nr:PadR family transcriptional regulator [Nitrososphaerota archaeon]
MLATKQQETQLGRPLQAESTNVAKQLVDVEILYLLTFSAKSGYELRKHLASWFKINISYGTLYPHLHALEKAGMVTGTWQQKFEEAPLKKRMYSLTPMGTAILRGNIESLSKISLTMQFMITHVSASTQVIPTISDEQRKALDLVEGFLSHRGYVVRKLAIVKGFSSQEYPLDLFAVRPEFKSSNIILRLAGRSGVSIDDILKMYVISFELEAARSLILVPSSTVSEDARKLAQFCHISIYTGQDDESAAANLISSYDASLSS